jgi:hypothetical protein
MLTFGPEQARSVLAQDAFARSLRCALKSIRHGSRASALPKVRSTQLVELLEVHPELRTCFEPVAESHRGVGGNAALA